MLSIAVIERQLKLHGIDYIRTGDYYSGKIYAIEKWYKPETGERGSRKINVTNWNKKRLGAWLGY